MKLLDRPRDLLVVLAIQDFQHKIQVSNQVQTMAVIAAAAVDLRKVNHLECFEKESCLVGSCKVMNLVLGKVFDLG